MLTLRDEQGFTLMELVVAAAIGSVVMLALLGLLDTTLRASTGVTNREDAAGRSRPAMDQMVQLLRSNVCVKKNPVLTAVAAGDDNSVTFFAPQPADAPLTTFTPWQWQLTYSANALTEKRWQPTGGPYPQFTYPATTTTATQTRPLVRNVHQAPGTPAPPIFAYYAYASDGTIDPINGTRLPTPLSAVNAALVGAIRIRFSVGAGVNPTPAAATDSTLDDVVMVRSVDPDSPQDGPVCRV